MGQEQSSNSLQPSAGGLPSQSGDGGVHLVRESGAGLSTRVPKDKVDQLLERSKSQEVPQQLLPPPPVRDDVSSALQGAQMMHELKSVLSVLLRGIEESPTAQTDSLPQARPSSSSGDQDISARVDGEQAGADQELGAELNSRASSIDEFSSLTDVDTRIEQDCWARLGIDQASVNAMLEQCTGGAFLAAILDRQSGLMEMIVAVKEKSVRLRKAMDRNSEEARRTTRALEKLDRINVALADVQENLESAVATANILGASHFAHDDEMCSFKNFLRHNPPSIP